MKIDGGELGAHINAKVSASGWVQIFGGEGTVGVDVDDKITANGSVALVGGKGGVRIVEKVAAR